MVKSSDYNTTYETHVICPWCGHKDLDSWEYEESGEYWCGTCEEPIYIEVEIEVTYSTYKRSEDD